MNSTEQLPSDRRLTPTPRHSLQVAISVRLSLSRAPPVDQPDTRHFDRQGPLDQARPSSQRNSQTYRPGVFLDVVSLEPTGPMRCMTPSTSTRQPPVGHTRWRAGSLRPGNQTSETWIHLFDARFLRLAVEKTTRPASLKETQNARCSNQPVTSDVW